MTRRSAMIFIIVGVVLLVGGSLLAIVFHSYTLFSLSVMSARDVVVSAALALVGLVSLAIGARAVVREKRRSP